MTKQKKIIYVTKMETLEAAMADIFKAILTKENKETLHRGINNFLLERLCDECNDIADVERAYPHLYGVMRYIVANYGGFGDEPKIRRKNAENTRQ